MEHEVEPATQVAGNVTLVEGSTFCVSAYSGQINADEAQGLFFRDVRIVSGWRLLLDGRTTQPLMVLQEDPYRATFIARVPPQGSQTELLVERARFVGEGMREDIRLRNLGQEPVTVRLSLDVAADFADVFAVKEHRVRPNGAHTVEVRDGGLDIGWSSGAGRRGIFVIAEGGLATHDGLSFDAKIGVHGEWTASVLVQPSIHGRGANVEFPLGLPWQESPPAVRLRAWRTESPHLITTGDPALSETLLRSLDDLGSLRLIDPEHPGEFAVAAGAPWFMALFGRDSLLTSYMSICLRADSRRGDAPDDSRGTRARRSTPPQRGAARTHPARGAASV